jgi:2-phospho-L-lactate/phosphoenolpyruvate guanylyltransferase
VTIPRLALLVPVKDGGGAKTRLGEIGDHGRASLMAAFARDAITAARRSSRVDVYVVGDPVALRPVTDGLDVEVIRDEGGGDLNQALRRAAERVAIPGRGVGAMLADLPCLRTEDLEAALSQALTAGDRAFVADADGSGTTLLVAAPGVEMDPRFGVGSARAHAESGAMAVTGELTSLRLDVDTTDDLDAALRAGVGPHTTRAVAELDRPARS